MRIIATLCEAKELQAGDLFSNMSQFFFDAWGMDEKIIAQKVYIRTKNPWPNDTKEKSNFYKITVDMTA